MFAPKSWAPDWDAQEANTSDEGKLKRISLTGADACGVAIEFVALLVIIGLGKLCLHRNVRPPLPVENLQRPPQGLENI